MNKTYELRGDGTVMVRLSELTAGIGHHWRIYAFDGSVVTQGRSDLFGEWPEGIEEEIIGRIAEYASAAQQVPTYDAYLRFKSLPKGERSRNHETGRLEDGVSVYALEWDVLGRAWKLVMTGNPFQFVLNSFRGDVPAYIVTGERVGTGSDGEPLIRNVTIVGPARKTDDGSWTMELARADLAIS